MLDNMGIDDAVGTSSSSDSESDFEEIDASPEEMDQMMQLETDLQANPNLYDSHIQVGRRLTHANSAVSLFPFQKCMRCSMWVFCGNASYVKSSERQGKPCMSDTP